MNERLLILEDEKNLGLTLSEKFKQEKYDVIWSQSIEDALLQSQAKKFDLALVDVGLPDGSGFDFTEKLRVSSPSTAVIFLTAFTSPEDRIRGLELGAEDYIAKPFHLKEILLRVKNGLKRAQYLSKSIDADEVKIGNASVCFSRFQAVTDKDTFTLTHKECALLKLLYERKSEVVSRDEILNHVWSEGEYPTARTVDNFILKLRKMIEETPDKPKTIESIRGVGYKLND